VSLLGVLLVAVLQSKARAGGNVFDRHNFGYLLKRKSEIYVATYEARLIFHFKLPDWGVAFRDLNYDCRVGHNASIGAMLCYITLSIIILTINCSRICTQNCLLCEC